jgi:amino acid adenylation domain-containing protein
MPKLSGRNLAAMLSQRALTRPTQRAFTFLRNGETESAAVSYAELDCRARSIAAELRRYVPAGQRVLILLPSGIDYTACVWGCIYAGDIAVPLYPPRTRKRDSRVEGIFADCGASIAIVESETTAVPDGVRRVIPATISAGSDEWNELSAAAAGPCLLQYTSGSTALPKGVVLTAENVAANLKMIHRVFALGESEVVVNWLPLFHDMGLIGNVLYPVFAGAHCVFMAPNAFLQRPRRWLEALSRYRATTSGGPNFAYEHCLTSIGAESLDGLDLTSWRTAFNGAEPVRAQTIERFAERFGVCGFTRRSFVPCYGLAEATLLVAATRELEGPVMDEHEGRAVVSCGAAAEETQIRIVDAVSCEAVVGGGSGEIWVAGPSVARRYWNRVGESTDTFEARLRNGEGPFLRTGDLGYVSQGRLFVTGRLKDLILLRGRNVHPQEIELAAEGAHASLRLHANAAFSATGTHEERIVLVQEVLRRADQDWAEVMRLIRRRVADELELELHAITLVAAGCVAKTTSGKVARQRCREMWEAGELEIVGRWMAEPATAGAGELGPEEWLLREIGARAALEGPAEAGRPLATYGLDSMAAVEIANRFAEIFRRSIALTDLLAGRVQESVERRQAVRPEFELDGCPLTVGQEALYFLEETGGVGSAYQLAGAWKIRGGLDRERLEHAVREAVKRHPMLAVAFEERDGRLAHRVAPWDGFDAVDAGGWAPERLAKEIEQAALDPFDLKRAVFRARLFLRREDEHVLMLAVHHIVSDLWSLAVIWSELVDAYCGGLREARDRFAEYVGGERTYLESPERVADEQFWAARLREWAPLDLRGDRPRPDTARHRGGMVTARMGPDVSRRLKERSTAHGCALFTCLLALYQWLLHRRSGQRRVRTGYPASGRTADFASSVGYFVNMIVMETELAADASFEALLLQVRDQVEAARPHQRYPFPLLSRPIQAAFAFQQTPPFADRALARLAAGDFSASLDLGGLACESIPLRCAGSLFDVTLRASESDEGIALSLEYDSDLFEEATASRMLKELVQLAACAIPESGMEPVHRRFERWAVRRPDSLALTFGERSLTYGDLNARANRLAHRLVRAGAAAESMIAVCLPRSIELVTAIVAVLKAGAAYLPLDPRQPFERLAYMAQDAACRVVVTDAARSADFAELAFRVVIADDDPAESAANPDVDTAGEALAYCIYTSGSTGRPKGVQVTHDSLAQLFDATDHWYGFSEADVWTLFHSAAFDFSVWELWGALAHGGRLVVVPYDVSRSPEEFVELLARERVTVLNQTPSAFLQLIQAEALRGSNGLDALRLVIFGGERLDVRTLAPWFERHASHPRLVNMYGITETTVHVTYRPIEPDAAAGGSPSPIGDAIPDQAVYLLDRDLREVAAGEIYVGGARLSRGYLNRRGLTAERFLPDPFSRIPGARMYRSGDLGRRLPDGGIEYLGRIDHQVKVRGFRIETGEIEAALRGHPAVRDAAVVPHYQAGETVLVGYVVVDASSETGEAKLRKYLVAHLPEYMIPARLATLERFPLNLNGKLDRSALPPIDEIARPVAARETIAPRNPAESLLVEVWKEVLQLPAIGVRDDFFELGGDSIRSLRVKARAAKGGLSFTLPQLLANPTIEGLAQVAEWSGGAEPVRQAGLVCESDLRILPPEAEQMYPLTRVQAGLVFHSGYNDEHETYVTCLRLRARFDRAALQQAVDGAVARHPILRTVFRLSQYSEPMQLVLRELRVTVETTDLRGLTRHEQDEQVRRWLEARRRLPIDWERAPLAGCHVHIRSDDEFHFTLVEPFLDGWSAGQVVTEILSGYADILGGVNAGARAPLCTSFRDYVALEREAMASAECRDFWERELAACEPCVVPASRAGSAPAPTPVQRAEAVAPRGLAARLKRAADEQRVSLKSVMLAAYLKVVGHFAGTADVVTGMLYNGRPESLDGDCVAGLFLNTVPFRRRLSGETWAELARAVHGQETRITPYRRYPLAEIQKRLGRRSLFNTVFNFTHFHIYRDLTKAARVTVEDAYASEQTYFDLTLQCNLDHESGELRIALDYRARLFTAQHAAEIAAAYVAALEDLAANPGAHHANFNCLSADEREVQDAWNRTGAAYREGVCLHELMSEQAARTPDRVAVRFEDTELTYAEAERRAEELCRALRDLGCGAESVAAVRMERSLDLVIALIGILRTGAAYLPIATDWPAERVQAVLRDSGALLLVEHGKVTRLAESPPSPAGAAGVQPENAAYVIYTSGSTGAPKGAVNTHRAIVNRLLWMQDRYRLGPDDRVLQKTPFTFDVSVWEFFWPLVAGTTLIVAKPGAHTDARYLAELIQRERITVAHFVPSMLRLFLDEPAARGCVSLRHVISSGEALTVDLQRRFFQTLPAQLHNLYGPTEAAVDVTAWECLRADERATVPIGRPIANARMHIVNSNMQLVRAGLTGRLLIGGVAVGRGYLRDPARTAQKFLPDPFSGTPGARCYDAGDLARYAGDGAIEYMGRTDHQIKLHGARLELGEIEAALQSHPLVRQAAVQPYSRVEGETKLAAYIVTRDVTRGGEECSRELRAYLSAKLPKYMLPHIYTFLDALPLNGSGKLDRKRLPAPAAPAQSATGLETLLSRIESLPPERIEAMLAEMERA